MFGFNVYNAHCNIRSRGGLGAVEMENLLPFWDLNHIPLSSSMGPDHFTE